MSDDRGITVCSPNGRRAHEVSLQGAINALAARGLHVIDAQQLERLNILNDPDLVWAALSAEMAKRGMHVVTAADMRVLDAMARVPEDTLRRSVANTLHAPEHSRAPCEAELARREARHG